MLQCAYEWTYSFSDVAIFYWNFEKLVTLVLSFIFLNSFCKLWKYVLADFLFLAKKEKCLTNISYEYFGQIRKTFLFTQPESFFSRQPRKL